MGNLLEQHILTVDRPVQADWEPSHPGGPTIALLPAYNEERFIGSLVLAYSTRELLMELRRAILDRLARNGML